MRTLKIIFIGFFLLSTACHTTQQEVALAPKAPSMTPHLATSTKDTLRVKKKLPPKTYQIDETAGQQAGLPVIPKPSMIKRDKLIRKPK